MYVVACILFPGGINVLLRVLVTACVLLGHVDAYSAAMASPLPLAFAIHAKSSQEIKNQEEVQTKDACETDPAEGETGSRQGSDQYRRENSIVAIRHSCAPSIRS